jgi:Txe/YoeB family toxin of Txe-Axe toxin-antitoxin module
MKMMDFLKKTGALIEKKATEIVDRIMADGFEIVGPYG